MSAENDRFEIVLDHGAPVVWAADRDAWRAGILREAIHRARALVTIIRSRQTGRYDPFEAGDIMLTEALERLLSSAQILADSKPCNTACEEECADDVLGTDRLVGARTASGEIVPCGLEGDPEASRRAPGRSLFKIVLRAGRAGRLCGRRGRA